MAEFVAADETLSKVGLLEEATFQVYVSPRIDKQLV